MTTRASIGSNRHTPPPRAWQRMLSGRRLDLLAPDPVDIDIADIAHGLARVARWNGQTIGDYAFSVAQHSIVVTDICNALEPGLPREWSLAALLHDAPEYVVGDLISPFKTAIGDNYRAVEKRLLVAIHQRVGLPEKLPDAVTEQIKAADRIAAFYEATRLAGFEEAEARIYFGDAPPLEGAILAELQALAPVSTATAQTAFLDRFEALKLRD